VIGRFVQIIEYQVTVAQPLEEADRVRRGIGKSVGMAAISQGGQQIGNRLGPARGGVKNDGPSGIDAESPIVGLEQMRPTWGAIDEARRWNVVVVGGRGLWRLSRPSQSSGVPQGGIAMQPRGHLVRYQL
jgi:hypothetical protein